MSIVQTTNAYSNSTSYMTPVVFRTSGGVQNGTMAFAWIAFNGTGSISTRASFNVSSISDYGTGSYGVSFSNAISSNYSSAIGASFQGSGTTSAVMNSNNYGGTTNFQIITFISTVGNVDPQLVTAAIFR